MTISFIVPTLHLKEEPYPIPHNHSIFSSRVNDRNQSCWKPITYSEDPTTQEKFTKNWASYSKLLIRMDFNLKSLKILAPWNLLENRKACFQVLLNSVESPFFFFKLVRPNFFKKEVILGLESGLKTPPKCPSSLSRIYAIRRISNRRKMWPIWE